MAKGTIFSRRNISRGAASKEDCKRFYAAEMHRDIMARICTIPEYDEDNEQCQRDLVWLENLKENAGLDKAPVTKKINPLKGSKRGNR